MAEDPLRSSKWHPVYTGPHHIHAVHDGGTYTLLDTLDEPMEPRRTANMLQLVSHNSLSMVDPSGGEDEETEIKPESHAKKPKLDTGVDKLDEKSYEIEEILDQRVHKGKQEYFVHWKNYSKDEATWEPQENFDGQVAINRFWKKRTQEEKEKKATKKTSTVGPRRLTRVAQKQHKF